jgi:hypothetical protein
VCWCPTGSDRRLTALHAEGIERGAGAAGEHEYGLLVEQLKGPCAVPPAPPTAPRYCAVPLTLPEGANARHWKSS